MLTGAAEGNEHGPINGHSNVPVDSFDEDHQVYLRLYEYYVEQKKLDTMQILIYIFELMSKKDLEKIKKIEYSKKFFTRYYLIDAETFNKWIEHFCPVLNTTDFKKKRKFTDEEAGLIFEKLGTLRNDEILPSTRKELIPNILHHSPGKKTKNYEAISIVFDEKYDYKGFNKLPPFVMKQILFEETLDAKYLENTRDLNLEKEVLYTIRFFEYYFPKYTDWEWKIRKRWVKRWFNKPITNDDSDSSF